MSEPLSGRCGEVFQPPALLCRCSRIAKVELRSPVSERTRMSSILPRMAVRICSHRPSRAKVACVMAIICLGVVVSTGAAAPDQPSQLHVRSGQWLERLIGERPMRLASVSRAVLGAVRAPVDTSIADVDSTGGLDARGAAIMRRFAVPSTPWDGTGWKGRVVVGELSTGFWCGPCWWHQREFDALGRRYPATAFIGLQYHTLSSPFMSEADNLGSRLYTVNGVEFPQDGVLKKGLFPRDPRDSLKWNSWVDGHATEDWSNANDPMDDRNRPNGNVWAYFRFVQKNYADAVQAIDAELQRAPEAVLRVQVTPHGGTLSTQVTVTSLAPGHSDVYVRIVLAEDTVHLVLGPRNRVFRPDFHMVVRDFARSAQFPLGVPLHGAGAVHYTFDVAKVQADLNQVFKKTLSDCTLYRKEHSDGGACDVIQPVASNYRINPKRLHVVAFVQDAVTGDVLQAQMVPASMGQQVAQLKLP